MDFDKVKESLTEQVDKIGSYLLDVVIVVVVTYLLVFLIKKIIRLRFHKNSVIDEKKKETVVGTISNTLNYVAFFVIIIAMINPFIDLQKLMVAGGVLGVVIGFGAQSLIKDILTGLFLLFEGQFKKGDFIHLNESLEAGVVEELGLRVCKIRLINGKLIIIPNGEIKKVVNGNIEKRRVFEGVLVSTRQEPEKVIRELESICEELNDELQVYLKKEIVEIDGELTEEYEEMFHFHSMSSLEKTHYGYCYYISATVNDVDYLKTSVATKRKMAQHFYEKNMLPPEQILFHKQRAEKMSDVK